MGKVVKIFDIETNGFLDELDRVHCIHLYDYSCGEFRDYGPEEIEAGIADLADSDVLVGHYIKFFDLPAIRKVYPEWDWDGKIIDTLIFSHVVFPDLRQRDFGNRKKSKLPTKLIGSHKLEAWGWRLGEYKGDFSGPWDTWTQDMHEYCHQDVVVNKDLYHYLKSFGFSYESLYVDQEVRAICDQQEANGFKYNQEAADKLEVELQSRRIDLKQQLQEDFFPPFYVKNGKKFTPKRDNKKSGYTAGSPLSKVKLIDFNPGSRYHIGNRLQRVYGWKPTVFTKDGKPKADEDALQGLDYPCMPLLLEYLMVNKRLGQLSEGKEAWSKNVGEDGRIHGRVNPMGTITGRATHSNPNMSQVPSIENAKGVVPYGKECRALFTVEDGNVLVGADQSGVELRLLAHYITPFDDGAYIEVILSGDKANGTDMHTRNANILCTIVEDTTRDASKRFFYAFIYGAGDEKLGSILLEGKKSTERQRKKIGKAARSALETGFTGLGELVGRCKRAHKRRGFVKGLDGRKIWTRSEHAALNTLLQGAGAVISKHSMVILHNELLPVRDLTGRCKQVGFFHDEFQFESEPDVVDYVGQSCVDSFLAAGERLGTRIPIDGEYSIGKDWSCTH